MAAPRPFSLEPDPRLLPRFLRHVVKTEDCWTWTGSQTGTGYGHMANVGTEKRTMLVHRLIYELLVGPIPDGMTIDHLCRNRLCVNPDHLEPVTHRENVLRGEAIPARNARKTHCIRGHAFAGRNLYSRPDGVRACRTCHRDAERQRRAQRAAADL